MFTFTPLLGAQGDSAASQSLLEFDGGVKVLIDVGWDESFSLEKLQALEKHIPTLSLILLTHATPSHVGAYAHCCKHFPLFARIPVYATTPVIALGRTLLQDLYASTPLASCLIPESELSQAAVNFPISNGHAVPTNILMQQPSADEIAQYFSRINQLKYSQPHQPLPSPFSPPLNGLTITAFNAGHSLGGSIWSIQHGLESVVYAADWNQARENIYAGAAWMGGQGGGGTEVIEQLQKPTAMICSARGVEKDATQGRRKKEEALIGLIRSTVRNGGTVLIPTDSSARVLELSYLLERTWRKESEAGGSLRDSRCYVASRTIEATLRYARSMLEWMDESIVREFEFGDASRGASRNAQGDRQGENADSASPLDFRHVQLVERKSQIERILRSRFEHGAGKVIVASDTSLEWGFSRDVLRRIASNKNDLIILTEFSSGIEGLQKPSLAKELYAWWKERSHGVAVHNDGEGDLFKSVYTGGRKLDMQIMTKEPLDTQETETYQQYLATQRKLQNTAQFGGDATLSLADNVDDASSSSSSSSEESDSEQQGKALTASKLMKNARQKSGLSNEALGVNVLLRAKNVFDYDVRDKKGRERMFPFMARRERGDEFGELIRPEDYLRAEERDEEEENEQTLSKAVPQTGEKRKWAEEPAKPRVNGFAKSHLNGSDLNGNGNQHPDGLEDDSSDDEPAVTGPSKLGTKSQSIVFNLNIAFVDFSGLHDNRDLRLLLPLVKPRKLILVGGHSTETTAFAHDCRTILKGNAEGDEAHVDVLSPANGVTVDASVDTNAWTVKLSDSLVKQLKWQFPRGLGVVHVTGILRPVVEESADTDDETPNPKKRKLEENSSEPTTAQKGQQEVPVLDLVPINLQAATKSLEQPILVGDLRLANLRRILQSAGHMAEFRGEGALLVDNLIAVRKNGTGKFELEAGGSTIPGAFGRSPGTEGAFYAVRRRIYEGLAVVAGV